MMEEEKIPDVAVVAVWAFLGVLRERISDDAILHVLRPEAVRKVLEFLAQQVPLTDKAGGRFSLDALAKEVNKELRDSEEESFVEEKSSRSDVLELKLEILKHIIAVRKDEAKEKERRLAATQQLRKIDEILESKEDDALRNKSPEELRKIREELAGA